MASNDPIDPRIRLAISTWPDNAPRGAVTAFCAEHGLSRKSFYKLRRIAAEDGPAAVLEPRSRRPHHSPARITDEVKQHAVNVRKALEESGWDYGPISVFDKMTDMGMAPPSIAALGRIFRHTGAAPEQPDKKPRSAYKRFVYPAPNCLWQIDGTQRPLANGKACVIFQLIDDHSRLALASHVDTGETARGALTVVRKAIDAHGVPQKFLSDNGLAFNVSRRGWISQLMGYLAPMGVQMVTGKPATPTTQGKNERFHQSLFQWLDRKPDPDSIPGMQALVDEFDVHYNTQRRHQSLSYRDSQGRTYRLTPQQAWDATPVATPPQPPDPVDQTDPSANSPTASSPGRAGWRENLAQSVQDSRAGKTRRSPVGEHLRIPDTGHDIRVVNARGYASFRGVRFKIGPVSLWAGVSVHVAWDPDCITFAGPDGEVLAIHEHPPAGVSYIGSGRPPGRPPKDPNAPG